MFKPVTFDLRLNGELTLVYITSNYIYLSIITGKNQLSYALVRVDAKQRSKTVGSFTQQHVSISAEVTHFQEISEEGICKVFLQDKSALVWEFTNPKPKKFSSKVFKTILGAYAISTSGHIFKKSDEEKILFSIQQNCSLTGTLSTYETHLIENRKTPTEVEVLTTSTKLYTFGPPLDKPKENPILKEVYDVSTPSKVNKFNVSENCLHERHTEVVF